MTVTSFFGVQAFSTWCRIQLCMIHGGVQATFSVLEASEVKLPALEGFVLPTYFLSRSGNLTTWGPPPCTVIHCVTTPAKLPSQKVYLQSQGVSILLIGIFKKKRMATLNNWQCHPPPLYRGRGGEEGEIGQNLTFHPISQNLANSNFIKIQHLHS